MLADRNNFVVQIFKLDSAPTSEAIAKAFPLEIRVAFRYDEIHWNGFQGGGMVFSALEAAKFEIGNRHQGFMLPDNHQI